MRYRLYIFGQWELTPVSANGDGARQLVPRLVFGPGWYDVRVSYRPYPFGDRYNPYGLIEQDGRWAGLPIPRWRSFQQEGHAQLRVILEELAD